MDEKKVQHALSELLSGRSAYDVAADLGVAYGTMMRRVNEIPAYREYKQSQKKGREAVLKDALGRITSGEDPKAVAESIGYSRGGLLNSLAAFPEYQAHRQEVEAQQARARLERAERPRRRAVQTDESLDCPGCSGTLEKRELYFWQCDCGCEFWPSEDNVPENPDTWFLPAALRNSKVGEALVLIKDMRLQGYSNTETAERLNSEGYTTISGKRWNPTNLHDHIRKFDIAGNWTAEREEILAIVESMAGNLGITCKEIADRLNKEGYRTSRNNLWTFNAVRNLVRSTLGMDIDLKRTRYLAPRKVVTGAGSVPAGDHPWRLANNASFEEFQEKQGRKSR